MRSRFSAVLLIALGVALLGAVTAGAEMVGIYRNPLSTTAQRSQLVKLSGRECTRGGFAATLRVVVGKRTSECTYRTPVLGRDLEIGASEKLLSGTPTAVQKKAYLGLVLRAGGGAKYELLVFPLQQKAQLIKIQSGGAEYLAIGRNLKAVKGLNEANALSLSALNVTSGPERGQAHLLAYVNGALAVEATDEGAGALKGRASGVLVGATKSANGVAASFGELVVRVPSPF